MAPPKSSLNGSGGAVHDASSTSASTSAAPASSAAHKSSLASKSASPSAHASSHKQPASSSSSPFVLPRIYTPPQPKSTNSSKRSSSPAVAPAPTSSSAPKRPSRDSIGNGDAKNGAAATDSSSSSGNATHYGTRSRNRTGGARPNYAEDRDIDVDMLADPTPSTRRDDEPKKPASTSASTNSNAWTISSLLDREPLRPTNSSANGSSERERSRKPLPGTSANGSESAATTAAATTAAVAATGTGTGTGSNHSTSNGNTKSSSHAQHKDKDKDAANSSASATANGNGQSQPSSSNSRKRKAAASSADKAATNGNGNGASQGASTSLLNISLKKNGAAAAAAAAAAASSSSSSSTAIAKNGVKRGYSNTNLMTFEKYGSKPNKDGKLVADDGTVLSVNDHVYLVCEPPGEPYYLARVMEFMHPKNNTAMPVDALRVNWYYRPRDIGRKTQDTRCIFATMHSDITPLTALRGKCTIKHKAEIDAIDQFRRAKDAFWFEKLYDRYIQKNYEVIPTTQIVNVPERVKRVLHERWRFVLVEQGRGKDLTAAAKQCKRCSGFCASNNSVDCAVCSKTYHMSCVRPPLLKKPSRGFAWSCAACSRAQERLLEARHTPNVIDGRTPDAAVTAALADEDEFMDDDDDECPGANPDQFEDPHPEATAEQQYQASLWPYRYLGIHAKVEDALDYDDRIYPRAATRVGPRHQAIVLPWAGRPVEYVNPPDIKKSTRREARQNKEAIAAYEREREARPKWVQDTPAGYVHRGEDYDESDERCTAFLMYKAPTAPPREPPMHEPTQSAFALAAASAKKKKAAGAAAAAAGADSAKMDLDPPEPEKKKADAKQDAKEAKIPDITNTEIDQYMAKAVSRATKLGVPKNSTNLHDVAADLLFHSGFNTAKALKQLDQKKATEFREPMLNANEQKRFEEAVTKFGSELNLVTRHVKTVFYGDIVRWYYAWKKSERGKIIWGNNASRKGKKEAKEAKKAEAAAANKIQDDVADDIDDSAFDTDKAIAHKRQFLCKFCNTKSSRQWRRAPAAVQMGVLAESLGGGNNRSSHRDRNQNQSSQQYVAALCRRCAELWRRYAVQWEDVEALTAKVASAGGRLVKRKLDDELMKEIASADDLIRMTEDDFEAHQASSSEPPRKKLKGQNGAAASASASTDKDRDRDRDVDQNGSDSTASSTPVPVATSSSRRRDRSDKSHADKTDKASADKDKAAAAAAAAANAEKTAASATGKSGAGANGAGAATSATSTPAAASAAPPAPEIPQLRKLPCAVCYQMELPTGDQRVTCRDCRLTVHRTCYGVLDNRSPVKWLCDMCSNDRNPHKSIDYRCVLCPVEHTNHELAPEPTRSTHKKKSDKDRERERAEREQAQKAIEQYRQRQEELNKPVDPREALKRTADNNWVHVTCAVWTPEVKFGKSKALEPSEGIPSVPRLRYGEMCKACKGTDGACVPCHQCRGLYHVECAHQAGHIFGFDLTPIKSSRRDQTNIVTINGVSGQLSAAIWCQEHVPLKGAVHSMHEAVCDSGMTVFQLYVENYKQADLALTGCARKANLLTAASKLTTATAASTSTSSSTDHAPAAPLFLNGDFAGRQSTPPELSSSSSSLHQLGSGGSGGGGGTKVCFTCGGDVSPKWHPIGEDQERELANGYYGRLGSEAQKFVDQRHFQCHQCKKLGRQPSPHVPSTSHLLPREREPEREPQPQRQQSPVHNGYAYPHQHQHQHQSPHQGQHQHQHQYAYGSSVVKTEEDTFAGAMQRVAPHYAQERGPSLPPPPAQARTPGQPPLPSLAQPLSQSPLAPPPMSRQASQPMMGGPPPPHHQQPPQGPPPSSHHQQHQQHQQHAHHLPHSQHSQHTQPPRTQSSHHHSHILHPVDTPRSEPLRRPSFSHAPPPPPQHAHQHTPVQTHAQTAAPALMGGGASRSPPDMSSRYWSSGAPPPPPPLPHQAPPPLSMRPSSRGSPSGGPPHSMHSSHPSSSHGMPHHSPHSMPAVSSRSSVGPPPPPPAHSYHNGAPSSSSSSVYSSWPRSSGGPPPLPPQQRRDPLHHSGSSSSMASPITHNHLRPPPPGTMQHSSSSSSNGMQNGSSGGYMSQGMMNGRPPSPPRRSMGGGPPPMSHERGNHSSNGYGGGGHSSYGGSSMSPHVQHSSPSHHFSQILHPQRSSAASSSNYGSVTREDFTLRGPASAPPPRPSDARDARNASSASSNPSLRNLLS